MNINKTGTVMGSVTAPAALRASDKLGAIGARFERDARAAAIHAIHQAGGANLELRSSAAMRNVVDGMISIEASWFDGRRRVSAKADLPVQDGKMPVDTKAFLASATEVKHDSPVMAAKTYTVDPAALRAKRIGDVISFQHDNLPDWNLHVSMEDLKASREAIETRIAASIQGFCVAQFERNADIPGGVKMPMVASEAPQQVAEVEAPKASEPTAAEQDAQVRLAASMPTVQDTGAKIDLQASASRQYEAQASVLSAMTRSASEAAINFVRAKLQGGSPTVSAVDLSGVSITPSKIEGSAVVAVSYYGNRSTEQAAIAVPFDSNGRVVASKVDRTTADIAAAEDLRSRMELVSEQEAKDLFNKFVEAEVAKQARHESLGIAASSDMGYGANWIKRGPADRIPIPKNALPAEFNVIGKKILIGGLVYEIQPTDYNAPSIARSAHWMLELRADIPASKADYAIGTGGLGEALSSVGL